MPAPGISDRLAQLLVAARGGKGLSGGAAMTFVALLLHADAATGIARPSIDGLAEMTGLHRRNVQRALDDLTRCGAIQSTANDGHSRSSGGRGRVTRFRVAPHAIRGDFAALCRRDTVAESPPISIVNSGEVATVRDQNGGDFAMDTDRNRGAEGTKPWRGMGETVAPAPPEHSEQMEQVPPNPPRGAGDRSATSDEPEARIDGEPRVRIEQRMQRAIESVGRIRNPFVLRGAVLAFLRDEGTERELEELIALSDGGQRSAMDRVGLVMHWITHSGVWRGVLADVAQGARESAPRRQASSTAAPAAVRDILRLPPRQGT